jgi:LysM repeat protein
LQDQRNHQRGIAAAVTALIITGFVTACANPTLSVSQAADSPIPPKDTGSLATGVPVAPPPSKLHYVVVEQGQSLNGIAHSHHLTPAALAAANRLQPPYKLKVGLRLVLPNSGPPPIQQANASSAPPPTPSPSPTLPSSPQPVPPSVARTLPNIAPLDGPPKESAAPQPPQTQALAAPVLPRAPPVLAPRNPAAALPLPGEAP